MPGHEEWLPLNHQHVHGFGDPQEAQSALEMGSQGSLLSLTMAIRDHVASGKPRAAAKFAVNTTAPTTVKSSAGTIHAISADCAITLYDGSTAIWSVGTGNADVAMSFPAPLRFDTSIRVQANGIAGSAFIQYE